MKVYFLADVHFGAKGDNETCLQDYYNYFDKIYIPYCKEYVKSDDILCVLGDWYDCRSTIGIHTMNLALDIVEQLSKIFSKLIFIVGNHDIFLKHSNKITSLNMFKYIPNVEIIYEPEVRKLGTKDVLFVPWIEEVSEQKALLKSYNVDYVFGHLEIGGCVTNSRKGIKLNSNNAIQSDEFKEAQVYAGHIHIRQDYKNIHYAGNPYSKDRGDMENQKGFTILDVESGRTKFVPNTYSPEYIKARIYDLVDVTVGDLKERWRNNYVDLVIKSNDYLKCNFDKLREVFGSVYRGFEIVTEKTEVVSENVDIKITETKSAPDMVCEYLEQCDMNDELKNEMLSKIKNYTDKIC